MKIKKLCLTVLLILSLAISCCGCSLTSFDDALSSIKQDLFNSNELDDSSVEEIYSADVEKNDDKSQDIDHTLYWNWSEGVYSNSFVGISFRTFEDWHQYTNEELIQLQDNDYSNLASVVKELYKERIVYAAYSNSEDRDSFFSLCYENKDKLEEVKGKKVSLDNYVSEYKTSMTFMLKDAEIISEGDVSFCGYTYKCLEFSIYTSYNGGGYIRKNIYFRQVDDYFITLTLTAGPFGKESIDDIVARCSALS